MSVDARVHKSDDGSERKTIITATHTQALCISGTMCTTHETDSESSYGQRRAKIDEHRQAAAKNRSTSCLAW